MERGQTSAPPGAPPSPDMVWIPGGPFHMGSDKHYPEERPVHRVTVDGFWMDRFPVTNERFRQFGRQRVTPRYRPAARFPEPVDTSTSHVGFRCIMRPSARS